MSEFQRPRRGRGRLALIGMAALLIGGLIGWAVAVILTPPADVLASSEFTYVKVAQGEVGSSISLNTAAEWTPVPVASNQASGVVTSVGVDPGQEVAVGAVLYTVNLRPVAVAKGDVPAFRTLQSGVTGADVAQLQAMLATLGFYHASADGGFGAGTVQAVRAWQKQLGVRPDGIVQLGDLVFVPTLPARVSLDTAKVKRGAALSGGEEVIRGLPAEPDFTIPVTESQAALMPTGTRVEISGPNGADWQAYVSDQVTDKDGAVKVVVAGKDGASICGVDCASIPVTEQSLFRSRIVTVETVKGLVVPSASLLSDAAGSLSVVDVKGVEHKVSLVASARGMAVITGVTAGMSVRLPATGKA